MKGMKGEKVNKAYEGWREWSCHVEDGIPQDK